MVVKDKHIIYGVDITKKVDPINVRDAIIECFYQAHSDVLDLAREYFGCTSEEKFQEMKLEQVKDLIETIFAKVGEDYNKPTKKGLIQVVENLKKIASIYREPDIIKKNAEAIMQLIDKINS